MGESIKNNNAVVDVFRLILCIMVVAIHTGIFHDYLYPWLSLAVPLFFIMSAYFFFNKIKLSENTFPALKKFVSKNLKYYCFYLVILSPFILYSKRYFSTGIFEGVKNIVIDFLFGATFQASWFLMALIIAVVLVCLASKYLSNKILLLIASVIYILITVRCCYVNAIPENSLLYSILNLYEQVLTIPYYSFPVAIIWVVIGKCLAENECFKSVPTGIFVAGGFVFSIALYLEWLFIKQQFAIVSGNSCFTLPFVAIAIFCLVMRIPPKYSSSTNIFRKFSAVTYPLHASVYAMISGRLDNLLTKFFGSDLFGLGSFFVTVLICIICTFLILKLRKYKLFSFLKVAC